MVRKASRGGGIPTKREIHVLLNNDGESVTAQNAHEEIWVELCCRAIHLFLIICARTKYGHGCRHSGYGNFQMRLERGL